MKLLLATILALSAQDEAPQGFPGLPAGRAPQVEIPFNRLYDYDGIYAAMDELAAQWPERLSYRVIGHSVESREMRVYTLNIPETGADTAKPAMWVDGNVHGNEVQGGEGVVYLAWYLLENYGSNERVTELLDRGAFYLLPMVNPDGRASWFADAHSAHSSRTGVLPRDDDQDGAFDEDPPNDLDGDGSITSMRKYVPGEGGYRLNRDDARILERIPRDSKERGDWTILGSEGLDDDGDGRINEDGVGGYDMNRAWPSMWMPGHVQRGAGPYPLYWPEARCIARFLIDHPNVAAVQSYHNAGGMILRGPGAEGYGSYPRADVAAYDELGKDGERMLPFYRYMVIWRDLYTVFGGFATWTYEGLGIMSFTNELWASARNSPDDRLDSVDDARYWFDDHLLQGAGFTPWTKFEHPTYGEVEIGGFKKDVGRLPPSFLIEEMLHRNAMFCIEHAAAMPQVEIDEPSITDLGGGAKAIDVVFRNTRVIATRTALAAQKRVGEPDVLSLEGDGLEVLAGGFRSDRYRPERIELQEHDPARLLREEGIGTRAELRVRWIVRGQGDFVLRFHGEKALDVERTGSL